MHARPEKRKPRRVLFVCSGNLHRSRAAQELLMHSSEDLKVKSAGTLPLSPNVLTKELIEWAEIIFGMEKHHKDAILQMKPEAEDRTFVLGIPDIYLKRDDPRLTHALRAKIAPYFKI